MSKIDDDRLPRLHEPKPDLGDRRRPPELCIASSSSVTRSTHNVATQADSRQYTMDSTSQWKK